VHPDQWLAAVGAISLFLQPQSPLVADKHTSDPCYGVPAAPPGVDINQNIAIAQDHPLFHPALMGSALGVFNAAGNAGWFRNMVRNANGRVGDVRSGRSWDYKQIGYADFGNFNYGATGRAVGFGGRTLLREAGRAQIQALTSRPGWGYPGNRANPRGGKSPYGDDPNDQTLIQRGIAYYEAGCNRR